MSTLFLLIKTMIVRHQHSHYVQMVVETIWSKNLSRSAQPHSRLMNECEWIRAEHSELSKSSPDCCLYCIAVIRTDRFAQPVHDDPTSNTPSSDQCLLQLMSTHRASLFFQFILISHNVSQLFLFSYFFIRFLQPVHDDPTQWSPSRGQSFLT